MRNVVATRSFAFIGAISLTLLAACDQPNNPVQPEVARTVAAPAQDRPFYYYEGQPVYLDVDPTTVVVSSREPSVAQAAQAVLSRVGGVQVRDEGAALSVPGHRVLRLNGANSDAAVRAVAALRADPRFQFASHAFRTANGGRRIWLLNQVDVQFKESTSGAQIDSVVKSVGARVVRTPKPDSGFFAYRLSYPVGGDPLKVAQTLDRSPLVAWADPDKINDFTPAYVPSDPFYSLQFHLKNPITFGGVPVDINAEAAWDLTRGSHSIRVTIIDDGLDILHGNSGGGFAGDLIGPFGGSQGYDLLFNLATGDSPLFPFGNDNHGTSIGGIIAATQDNGVGVAGIAPNVTTNIVRIFRRTYPPFNTTLGTQTASDAQIGDGINNAWQGMNSDVINNSWGGGSPSNAITNAINNALTLGRGGKGTVVVFSAGNTSQRQFGIIGGVQYPANLSSTRNVISVGAINRNGGPADYTPNGVIDVVAPSGNFTGFCTGELVTIDRYGSAGCNDGPTGAIDFSSSFSGTSGAAPQVAAVAALMLSLNPNLTAAQVKTKIRSSANPWGAAITFGAGKLNAFAALQ